MNLYQEEIIDHYKNPRNKYKLEKFTHEIKAINSLCGDSLIIRINIEDGIINKVGFEGDGCAVSQASMSMLSEKVLGMKVESVKLIGKDEILEMLGVEIGPGRLKCAMLPLKILDEI